MALELWIAAGLALFAVAGIVAARLRGGRRRDGAREPKNIYPLW